MLPLLTLLCLQICLANLRKALKTCGKLSTSPIQIEYFCSLLETFATLRDPVSLWVTNYNWIVLLYSCLTFLRAWQPKFAFQGCVAMLKAFHRFKVKVLRGTNFSFYLGLHSKFRLPSTQEGKKRSLYHVKLSQKSKQQIPGLRKAFTAKQISGLRSSSTVP